MSTREFVLPDTFTLAEGEMKQISADGVDVLITRLDGHYHAVGAYCPHYGAPLVDGFLSGDRIVCPWHHACFNARTGREEEPPAFDSLPSFRLKVEGGRLSVCLPAQLPDPKSTPVSVRGSGDERVFVILGGGAAGYMAAQTLREEAFTGRIVMVTREDRLPYDRPNLSKDYLSGHAEPEWMPLRGDDFFAEHNIEVMCHTIAASVNSRARDITFEDGKSLKYDTLLVATGAEPRVLPFQTGDENNVFVLRTFADADRLIAVVGEGKRAVIIGSSFIGMEAAASLRSRGCEVTVISPDSSPFQTALGTEIGLLFQSVHERNGVEFKLRSHVTGFCGDECVDAVICDTGERIDADVVLVAIGVKPATDLLRGIELHEDGGVIADAHLSVAPGVYAAGDVAYFPDARTGELIRIEHWRTALQQGRTAAQNMLGQRVPFTAVPFFWTTQFDLTLNYVGHVSGWDRIEYHGDVHKKDFLAFYVKNHRILAVAGMNRDRELAIWEELIRLNRVPAPGRLSDGLANVLNGKPTSARHSAPAML